MQAERFIADDGVVTSIAAHVPSSHAGGGMGVDPFYLKWPKENV